MKNWTSRIFAYIPARGGSRRIPRKNIRLLDDTPVISHVIRTLRKLTFLQQIFVSTDDQEIADISESLGAKCLEFRRPELAGNDPGFIDLIRKDIPRYARANGDDDEVLFVLATAALVSTETFNDAYEKYCADAPDVLMSCEEFHMSPFWAMTKKPDGYWHPIFPEKVMVASSDLPTTLIDAGLFYFFRLETMERYKSLKLTDRLLAYVVPEEEACDVDTENDWRRLEEKFLKPTNFKSGTGSLG